MESIKEIKEIKENIEIIEKMDAVTFDIAFLAQDIAPVYVACKNVHTIQIDPIPIHVNKFKRIFYSQEDFFGLNKGNQYEEDLLPFTCLNESHRTIDKRPFSLLEEVVRCIEEDLNVTRSCFTTKSLLELTRDIKNISTLYHLDACSLVSALKWSNIVAIMKSANKRAEYIYFVITILFKTANVAVLPIMVKLKYKIRLCDYFIHEEYH
jgi:hypothetical protein